MKDLDVVKVGARRKIGDGYETRDWHGPWLPNLENGCLTTVNNLFDETSTKWDMELINDVFNGRDAELIKRVPTV